MWSADREHGPHRGSQGRSGVAELRGDQLQQIIGRRTECACARQGRDVPVGDGFTPIVVPGGEPLLQRIPQGDRGAGHRAAQ